MITYSVPVLVKGAGPKGSVLVEGKCTDASIDSDRQIIDPQFASEALRKWFDSGGNIRSQHHPQDAVGRAVWVRPDGHGGHLLRALVVSRKAARLVRNGVLRAFSVGIANPRIVRDDRAPGGRIVGGDIVEVSLVDRPSNKGCYYQLCKSEHGMPVWTGELITKARKNHKGRPGGRWGSPVKTRQVAPYSADRISKQLAAQISDDFHRVHDSDPSLRLALQQADEQQRSSREHAR